MNTLMLHLQAPLQAWGAPARWDQRGTASFPTRSGLLGLLACAQGSAPASGHLERLGAALRFGVRADRAGRLISDLQLTQAGTSQADGKKRPYGVYSQRQYLADAAFVAAVQSEDGALLADLATALQAPVWPLYLGRRACVPSVPIYGGLSEHADLLAALAAWPRLVPAEGPVLAEIECLPDAPGAQRRDDALVNAPARWFGPRWVRYQDVTPTQEETNV